MLQLQHQLINQEVLQKHHIKNQPKAIAANDNTPTGVMPLNKFMAHCGVCSRRDAVEFINAGKVKVNGKVVTEPGYKVRKQMKLFTMAKNYLLPKTWCTSY